MSQQSDFLSQFNISRYRVVNREPVVSGNIPFSLQDYNSLIGEIIQVPQLGSKTKLISLVIKAVQVSNNQILLTLRGVHGT